MGKYYKKYPASFPKKDTIIYLRTNIFPEMNAQ